MGVFWDYVGTVLGIWWDCVGMRYFGGFCENFIGFFILFFEKNY